MSRCAKCGCEKESPFDGKTVIHDEARCGSLAAPSGSVSPVTDDAWDAYNRKACGLHYIAHKMREMEKESVWLRDIIRRARVQFFHEGADGETASQMLAILSEAAGIQPIGNAPRPPNHV